MSILARHLSKMILLRFAVILSGLTAFVLTLDVVGFLNEILHIADSNIIAILTYCLMRLPGIFSLFLPTSLLLALLLTMTELSYKSELTAIWATGISPTRLIIKLLPLAIALGCFSFLIIDQGVPRAAQHLHKWGIGDYATRQFKTDANDPIWIRSGTDIIRAEKMTPNGAQLTNLIIFKRDDTGKLNEQIFANSALQKNGQWLLKGVKIYRASGEAPRTSTELTYDGPLHLAGNKVPPPEEMSLLTLTRFVKNNGFGVRPVHVYETWAYKRLTPIFVTVVMVALCVPLGTSFRRGGGLGLIFILGVALGFSYFVSDGLAMTFGELGTLSPFLAAWGPILIFAAIAAGLIARTDHL